VKGVESSSPIKSIFIGCISAAALNIIAFLS